MTTRPIELGLKRETADTVPAPWQVQAITHVLATIPEWSADPESPRTSDFRTRLDRLRQSLTGEITIDELADVLERALDLCETYFGETRTVLAERERELGALVQVLRDTLADLAGQAKSFNVDLIRTTDRIGTLANIDDIRELRRRVATEARDLKNAVVEKQRRDDVLFMQLSRRVDALQTQLAEAQKEAEQDPLTGLANRRGFDRTLREWAALASRTRKPFALAMVDVDDLKAINETHGHQVGDRVLLCLAQRLTSDADEKDFVARYGGEEFAVLLRNAELDKATARLDLTLQRLSAMDYEYQHAGQTSRLRFTSSAGIAEYCPGEPLDDFIRRADRALSEAKRAGKNRANGKRRGLLSSISWLRAS